MKQKLKTIILFVLLIAFLFFFWEYWNRQVYIESEDFLENMRKYLSGFLKLDKKCMGWLFIHMPVQCYLIAKQSDFMRKFAVLWYFRNKNLHIAFWGFYKLYWKIPFIYYFFGLIIICWKRLSYEGMVLLWRKMLIFCVFFSIILTLTVMSVCTLIFLCFLFFVNYQVAFSVVFLWEITSVMQCCRAIEKGASFHNYWYMPFRGMMQGKNSVIDVWDNGVLFTEVLKVLVILAVCMIFLPKKYSVVMGMDE